MAFVPERIENFVGKKEKIPVTSILFFFPWKLQSLKKLLFQGHIKKEWHQETMYFCLAISTFKSKRNKMSMWNTKIPKWPFFCFNVTLLIDIDRWP